MIQLSRFDDGGFVLHKVNVGKSTYSAWYDKAGALLDAERRIEGGSYGNVPQSHRLVRYELDKIGKRYVG